MPSILFFAILSAIVIPALSAEGEGTLCNTVFNLDAYYSVAGMKETNYYQTPLTSAQGNVSYPLTVTPTALAADYSPQVLYFNFCATTKLKTTDGCYTEANANPAFALTLPPDSSDVASPRDCTKINKLTTDSRFENYEFKQIDPDKPQLGIVYSISRSDQTANAQTQVISTFNKTISYIMYCDNTNSTNVLTVQGWKYFKNDTNEIVFLQVTSKYGCPTLQLSKIWQILSESKVLFTIVMFALGLVLCFFGLKIYQPTLFIIGNITGFCGIVVVLGEWVIRYDSESVMAYACLLVAVLFGVLVGYVTVSMPRAGFFALGMWLGIVMALLFNNAVLYKIQIGNQSVVLWVTIGVLSMSMGLLSCFYYKHCVMICTGFIGAYCLIRPIGWILGSFPNELKIAKELKYGTITEVPALFYLYFALIILIGLIGIKFQYSMYLGRRQAEEQDDLQLFLADPDFIELNKSLLDRDDEDLTEKEKETKKKLIRMQRNVEKEQKRQDKFMQNANKLRKNTNRGSDDEEGEDDEDDDDDAEGEDSEGEYDNGSSPSKSKKKGNNSKNDDTGFFSKMSKSVSSGIRKSVASLKSKVKKQQKADSDNSDDDEEFQDVEKNSKMKNSKGTASKQQQSQNAKKAKEDKETKMLSSNLFAGIKKTNSKKANDSHAIEMDEFSDQDQNDMRAANNNRGGSSDEGEDDADSKKKQKSKVDSSKASSKTGGKPAKKGRK